MSPTTTRKAILAVVLLLLLTSGCSAGRGGGRPPVSRPPSAAASGGGGTAGGAGTSGTSRGAGGGGPFWIVSGQTLARLIATDRATATRLFDTPSTYVLTGSGSWDVPAGWSSTPTADFTSYREMRAALADHRVDPRIRAALYDNEHWGMTPASEQADPARYDRLAAQLAHRHQLTFLAAPSTDLASVLRPGLTGGEGAFGALLDAGLFGRIAPSADVLDIQGQGAEPDPAKFAAFVRSAAAQARSANPDVRVLAGISTNPSGQAVTAAGIERAAQAVRRDVDGFWLNDPAAGAACPRCTGPLPQTALAVASALDG
ncbi:hypothetical protein [Streptacidiphilus neutrinimicus]|uniref:hypothetical protein n=1 Tax=Streptacidiphilus neutrinimicus TaxID=105420 RepID=UPI0005A9A640|nr:hypothetical protein [Streptacidiphilus neutrinimicus]